MNISNNDYLVKKNQKIAQMVINKVEHFDIQVVDNLSQTERDMGGFGSTGIDYK